MSLFKFIKTKVSIVDVVNEYTSLKKAGYYLKGTCPFHQEKTASFTVSPHKEIFYCFGCHATGDVISFIEQIEHCTPVEAVKFLADRYNISLPQEEFFLPTGAASRQTAHDRYKYIYAMLIAWSREQLAGSPEAMDYLDARSMSAQSRDYFDIGYFPGGHQGTRACIQALGRKNILLQDLTEAGIFIEGQHGNYSPFEERILFPIIDHMGHPCGFGGRVFRPDDTRPKYYNSRDSAYFNKGSLLFGFDKAKRAIREHESVFLVEGYMDCIAMVQYGYHNTVATLGTACTQEHIKTLARYAKTLYVVYDGDKAGQEAMLRLADMGWESTIDMYTLTLPSGEDPASVLSREHSIDQYISKAADIVTFFVTTLGTTFSQRPLQEKLQLSERIVNLLRKIDDPLKQEFLLQKTSQILGIPTISMKQQISRQKQLVTKQGFMAPNSAVILPEISKLEQRIFAAIINNMSLIREQWLTDYIHYSCKPLQDIIVTLQAAYETNKALDFTDFFAILNSEEQHTVVQIMMACEEDLAVHEVQRLVHEFDKRHWKVKAHTIAMQLEQARRTQDTALAEELLREFVELKKKALKIYTIEEAGIDDGKKNSR